VENILDSSEYQLLNKMLHGVIWLLMRKSCQITHVMPENCVLIFKRNINLTEDFSMYTKYGIETV
jgi:hypothetical protein